MRRVEQLMDKDLLGAASLALLAGWWVPRLCFVP